MKKFSSQWRKIISFKYFPIILLILINLIIGALVLTDYGESRDEHLRYRYAEETINYYLGSDKWPVDGKGPFYVVIALLGSKAIQMMYEGWMQVDAWHFIHFLSFQLGLFFLYRLCMRYTDKWAAFGAVLLFNTQPLLWGHSFINPKDIPFMSFFLASVDMGLAMADSPEVALVKDNEKVAQEVPFKGALGSKLAEDWGLARPVKT